MSVLFPLLSIYTVGFLALSAADFLLGPALDLPEGMMPLYIALLGAYATDKEIRRWIGLTEPPRKGTIFVYLWLLLYLGFYLVQVFKPNYAMPPHMLSVCLQVLGIFFGSKTSKYLHSNRTSRQEVESDRRRQVLEMIKAQGRITRQMVEQELRISSSHASRLLQTMERAGLIVRHGSSRSTHYTAAETGQS